MSGMSKSLVQTGAVFVWAGWTLAALATAPAAAIAAPAAAAIPAAGNTVPAAADTVAEKRGPITIGAARRLPVGTVVTVMGSVSVPSGLFASSFGDEGFAVQDSTGGIYVSVAENPNLTLQQRVEVTGAITDNEGLIELVPASNAGVVVEGRGFKVRPQWERTGHVGPANQGLLVYVVGIITQPIEPDPPYGNKMFVSDGSGPIRVFINSSTDIDLTGFAPGQFVSVIGFSSAFDTPEIDPRFQSDLSQPVH
jgi:hypothetical protein